MRRLTGPHKKIATLFLWEPAVLPAVTHLVLLFDYIRLRANEKDDFHQFFIDCTDAGMRPPRAMKSAQEPALTGMIGA